MKILHKALYGLALMLCLSSAFGQRAARIHKTVRVQRTVNIQPSQPLQVVVNGEVVNFEGAQPQVVMGRILVPLRGVFEKIGAYVEYDPARHIIDANIRNESVEIRLGNRIANRNGALILMEVPARIINGNALVPLRFLAESMGATVDFDQDTNTVNIQTG